MRSLLVASLLVTAALSAMAADELHMRDGAVIVGTYVGGTDKAVYFQRTAAGADMYPLFMVESVKFNATPAINPGASLNGSNKVPPVNGPFRLTNEVAGRMRSVVALFLPSWFSIAGPK